MSFDSMESPEDGNPDPSLHQPSRQIGNWSSRGLQSLKRSCSTSLNCHILCTAQVRVQVEKGHVHYRNERLLQIAVSSQVSHQNRSKTQFNIPFNLYGFHTIFHLTSPMPLASIFPHLHYKHMQTSDLPTLSCRNALAFPLFSERQFGHSSATSKGKGIIFETWNMLVVCLRSLEKSIALLHAVNILRLSTEAFGTSY